MKLRIKLKYLQLVNGRIEITFLDVESKAKVLKSGIMINNHKIRFNDDSKQA